MLNLSTRKILINKNYFDFKYFKSNKLTQPVLFASPFIAFRVSISTENVSNNFIEETILCLKKNGLTNKEIADALCLDADLIDLILFHLKKDIVKEFGNTDEGIDKSLTTKTKDGYILYDLLNHRFVDKCFIKTEFFQNNLIESEEDILNNYRYGYFRIRENLGSSDLKKVNFLDLSTFKVNDNPIPTSEIIINCAEEKTLFDSKTYKKADYLNDSMTIWIVFALTSPLSDEMIVLDPFKSTPYSSIYFKAILDNNKTSFCEQEIYKYKVNLKVQADLRANNAMSIKSPFDEAAMKYLKQKYSNKSYFGQKPTKFEVNLLKLKSIELKISKYINEANVLPDFKWLCEYANTSLEEFLMHICFEPTKQKTISELKKDNFFEKFDKCKTIADEKSFLINSVIEPVTHTDDFNSLVNGSDLDSLFKSLKKDSFSNTKDKQFKVKELFILNLLSCYVDKNVPFSRVLQLDSSIVDTIHYLHTCRNKVRHDNDNFIVEYKEIVDVVFRIIDAVLNVDAVNANETIEEIDDERFETHCAQYDGINQFPEELQTACNKIIYDVYSRNELYYSDCVIGFEKISSQILDIVMQEISSIYELNQYLKLIPDDNRDAKEYLMEKLFNIDLSYDETRISIDIKYAKECIKKQEEFNKASTLILFAPILLATVNKPKFQHLFKQLGDRYLADAIDMVNNRGHNGQASDWNNINLIENRFVEYCKIVTEVSKEGE